MKYVNITYECDICCQAMDGENLHKTDIILQGEYGFQEKNIVMCNMSPSRHEADKFILKDICEDCHSAIKKYISILATKE